MLKKEKLAIIRKWYPNAVTTIDSVNKLIDFAEEKLELEPTQVMLADSICSDDVNSIQYPARALEFLGPFKMGGLDGFPFTGLTGMGAFASHVPDSGAVFIYYGPHIGITKTGTIGEIHRFGQSKNSGCCGAAKGALNKLLNNEITEGNITEIDYQMNTIEQILFKQKDRITKAETPLFEATEVIYEAIDKRINELVEKTNYNCRYVILMGAVLINSDTDMGSYSSTKRFDCINLATKERTSFMEYLFNPAIN
jgi:Limiting CO2-inducible proteins B/C beta carbonyic anhydrases